MIRPVGSTLLAILLFGSGSVQSGVNSGGGLGRVGSHYSFGSVGSPFATGVRVIDGGQIRSGLVPVLAPWHISPDARDSDGDGMSDAWEIANQLNPDVSNTNVDTDFDGFTDYEEFVTGTHPRQSASRFVAGATADTEGIRIQFTTLAGRKYRIERSTNLSNWMLETEVIGNGSALDRLITVPANQLTGFYRIVVTMHRP